MKCLAVLIIILAILALILLTSIYDIARSSKAAAESNDEIIGSTLTPAAHDAHTQLTARANLTENK